jgi:hypothetical protein
MNKSEKSFGAKVSDTFYTASRFAIPGFAAAAAIETCQYLNSIATMIRPGDYLEQAGAVFAATVITSYGTLLVSDDRRFNTTGVVLGGVASLGLAGGALLADRPDYSGNDDQSSSVIQVEPNSFADAHPDVVFVNNVPVAFIDPS